MTMSEAKELSRPSTASSAVNAAGEGFHGCRASIFQPRNRSWTPRWCVWAGNWREAIFACRMPRKAERQSQVPDRRGSGRVALSPIR